jgi:amino acid adenylation domain-containing protein
MHRNNNILYLHGIIESQAKRFPNRIALIFEDRKITYGQLNIYANKLGRYLKTIGVGRGTLVAIYAERSIELLIFILGILKAGATYIPLDPTYPKERTAFILKDTNADVLIAHSHLTGRIPIITPQIVYLNINQIAQLEQRTNNLDLSINTLDLAYIIYTSGTTGNPKGVMITHENICSYVYSLAKRLNITSQDRYLHTAPFAFSSSNRQFFLPLSMGCQVIITNSEQRVNPLLMFQLIKSKGITIIDLVPSHMRSCINVLEKLNNNQKTILLKNELRLVLSASETLLSDIPQTWQKLLASNIEYINMYGLTETTGIISSYKIAIQQDDNDVKAIPIGWAIDGMNTYILDENMVPVPPNTTGMLYVSGPNLFTGYFNYNAFNKILFFPNTFTGEEHPLLFKTGDFCKYNEEGCIEHIGRIDNLIKINGIRIEPKEIELTINSDPAIHESIVVSSQWNGENYLIAYIVIKDIFKFTVSELRKKLIQELPAHLVPRYFVKLDFLPLTPNGKIDRLSLPTLNQGIICYDQEYTEPRNEIETNLIYIWRKFLNIKKIGIYNNFFEMGGNSLIGYQIITKINDNYKVNLRIVELFQYPTIAELSEYLQNTYSIFSRVNGNNNHKRGKI